MAFGRLALFRSVVWRKVRSIHQHPFLETMGADKNRWEGKGILFDCKRKEGKKRFITLPSKEKHRYMEATSIKINENIRKVLPKVRQYLSGQPVLRAWLFGSYSRGEETTDSDIDILVQYKDAENISLFTISRIMCSLSRLLNRKVDLVEEDGLLPFATESVNHDRILIYERKS